MKIAKSKPDTDLYGYDTVILPFSEALDLRLPLPEELRAAVAAALASGRLAPRSGDLWAFSLCFEGRLLQIVLVYLGDADAGMREVFLNFAKALRICKAMEARNVVALLDNADLYRPEVYVKLCELPFLVSYDFTAYKTQAGPFVMETVEFATEAEGFETILNEAVICAESVLLARDLTNHPSMYMTPARLAEEARKVGAESGIEV